MRRANRQLLNAVVTAVEVVEATAPRRSADIYTISPADLRAAEEVVQRYEQEWRRVGSSRPVTAEQVEQALEGARKLGAELDHAKARARPSPTWIYLNLVRLFVLTRLPTFGKIPVLGGTAAVVCSLSLLSTPFLFRTFGAALQGATALTAVGFCLAAPAVLLLWPSEPKRAAYQRLRQQRTEWAERVETLRPATEQAWADYKRLREEQTIYGRLEKARQRRQELTALLASAKYQLIHMDWRSLRGADFEHFLSRAFEMLGYRVGITKASGDQGADLIVTGKGQRIAVQAKGYADSVGNHSVMEVVAGMNYYQCTSCLVVTNSHFTSTARQLAQANRCQLIDGTQIPDLIEGRIY